MALDSYKYDLVEYGIEQEFFHCAEDNAYVRAKVFNIIQQELNNLQLDSLIIEKSKTALTLRDSKEFYPKMLGYLLRYVIERCKHSQFNEIFVITDSIPINKKRQTVEKSIKLILAEMLPKNMKYRIIHHPSKAHYGLQIADYCNWAILRKWERNDLTHYQTIQAALKSELKIF